MYRLAPAELTEVKAQINNLLERGLIEPSTSASGNPILFVRKKTGELRMVVDYRVLNKLKVKNRYPLPRVDDVFDELHGAKYFSSLDAASGFHQILLNLMIDLKLRLGRLLGTTNSRSFGLTNAPATCQTVVNKLFNPPHFGRDGNEQLHIKPSKCVLGQTALPWLYCGEGRNTPDPKTVQAVTAWPTPITVQEIQQFRGLTNFFRKIHTWLCYTGCTSH